MIILLKRIALVIICAFTCSWIVACGGGDQEEEKTEKELYAMEEADQIAYLDKKIEANPNLPSLYVRRGELRLKEEEYQAAIADFKEALKLDSTNKWAWYKMAKAQRKTGNVVQLISSGLKAKNLGLKDQGLYTLLGEGYFLLKKYDRALLYLNNSLKMNPYEPSAYYYKGLVYREKGDTARAISSFQTTIEQEPNFFDAYNTLAETLMKQGKWRTAQEYLETGLSRVPAEGIMNYNLGVVLQQTGHGDSSKQYYRKALAEEPQLADAAFNLATLFFQKRTYDSAAVYYDKAWKANPGMYKAAFQYALSLDYLGKDERARSIYEQLAADQRNPYQGKAERVLRKFQRSRTTTPKRATTSKEDTVSTN